MATSKAHSQELVVVWQECGRKGMGTREDEHGGLHVMQLLHSPYSPVLRFLPSSLQLLAGDRRSRYVIFQRRDDGT
eukprot:1292079-Rhodomonas_salina.2